MILDSIAIGAILVGCLLISIIGYKKFQPGIERELKKSEEMGSLKTRSKK